MYALQPAKQSNGPLRALTVIGAIALLMAGATLTVALFPLVPATTAPAQKLVVYRVTTDRDSSQWPSCFGFDTTYETADGTAQRQANICNGAKFAEVGQFYGAPGDFVYLSVQNDEFAARIGCQIYIDGKLAHQTYSSGQHVIANCRGSVP